MARAYAHAIITGGSSGIGLACARALSQGGTALTLMARDEAKLSAARTALAATHPRGADAVLTLSVDVSDRAAMADAVAKALAHHGPCDALIASAGIAHPGHFADIPPDVFERSMAINYFGVLNVVRPVVVSMRAQGQGGDIALISSGAAFIGIYGYSAYAPTKFALRGLGEVLRRELKAHAIRVCVAYPPDTDTPQLAAEQALKPKETQAITASAGVWSAERVADAILTGMARGRAQVTPGWELSALSRIHSVMAPLLNAHFDRIGAKARRKP
ncbi:MAG: SDR family oxidoreductase [Pseudomonadota bacterium]